MDFELFGDEALRTTICPIASATVIEAGDLVEVASGLIVKATATGAKLAWSPKAKASGETQIECSRGNAFLLVGTGDAVFAAAQRGKDVDLVVNSNNQQIDVGTSSTKVLTIDFASDAGVVGSASNIHVKIALPVV